MPPSKFEIHACNSYRRASEYICLENGKSLLDVVKECRKGSLKTLEETIQSVIGPVPVKKSLFCRDCKGELSHANLNIETCPLTIVIKRYVLTAIARVFCCNTSWK